MAFSNFTPTVLTIPSTGTTGTGTGELNVVTNSSATTDLTGWTATGLTASRQATGSPLDPVIPTGFQLTASATSQTLTSSSLSVPVALRNRKLKLEFSMTMATAAFKVDVLNSSGVRFALTTDSGGVSNLPALSTSGKYVTYFDMDAGSTITVRFTSTASSGTLSFTNVIVGPGIQPQGAVVGEWQSYTPTITGYGTVTNVSMNWMRIGRNIRVLGRFTTGSVAATAASITLPSSLNSDSSVVSVGGFVAGQWWANVTAAASLKRGVILASNVNSNTLAFSIDDYTTGISPFAGQNGSTIGSSSNVLEVDFTVPIAQWAGSGNVQLAQNDVEFAYNTDTSVSDNALAFGYGPSGQAFGSFTSNATNSVTRKRVRFQSPIQVGDVLVVEVDLGNGRWVDVKNTFIFNQVIGTGIYGIGRLEYVNNTDVDVSLGKAGARLLTNTLGTTNDDPWSNYISWKWRVRKSSAGAAVGFGIVSSQSAGLLPATNANLDDATATRLGLKQYLADKAGGTNDIAYFGGNKATLTASDNVAVTISSVTRAVLIPYQTQDGNWRLKFNINFVLPSAARASASVFINGVTGAAYNQASSAHAVTSTATNIWGLCYSSTNPVRIQSLHASATTAEYMYSGDIELASKPTWAYS